MYPEEFTQGLSDAQILSALFYDTRVLFFSRYETLNKPDLTAYRKLLHKTILVHYCVSRLFPLKENHPSDPDFDLYQKVYTLYCFLKHIIDYLEEIAGEDLQELQEETTSNPPFTDQKEESFYQIYASLENIIIRIKTRHFWEQMQFKIEPEPPY